MKPCRRSVAEDLVFAVNLSRMDPNGLGGRKEALNTGHELTLVLGRPFLTQGARQLQAESRRLEQQGPTATARGGLRLVGHWELDGCHALAEGRCR